MFVVESYALAVVLCVITMLCWGSWANTQKLASREWRFQLFYWDYALGVFLFALAFALTLGSTGTVGRGFAADLAQAGRGPLFSAFVGGVVFNLSNILLVAAIDVAGMAVAFPIGVGLALVLGVLTNYLATPVGNPLLLFVGVGLVVLAIVLSALAYRRLPSVGARTTGKGIALSVVAGLLMGYFYRFVAASMFDIHFEAGRLVVNPEAGMLSPYTALVAFATGLLLSTFVWNSLVMVRPFVGEPVPFADYIRRGSLRLHLVGLLGGAIWNLGMSLSIVASGAAGFAISYGLGQGATLVAALWGVFVWKEFKGAPDGTNALLAAMFASFVVGLSLVVASRLV
jgi:glucose uptake protein